MKAIQVTIIASLFAVMLMFSGTQLAEGSHLKKAEDTKSSKSFGTKTSYKICGDMICLKVTTTTETVDNKPLTENMEKHQEIKNSKKADATKNAIKFWEQYYKQSAPLN